MKKRTFELGLFLLVALFAAFAQPPSAAQDSNGNGTKTDKHNYIHYTTALPADARYEVIQSEIAARWTFRLDRFTGQVYKLGQIESGQIVWEKMPVWKLPKTENPSKPRFQLFVSGFSAGISLLIDTYTGKTWGLGVQELKTKKNETIAVTGWFPVKELKEFKDSKK